MIQGNETNDYYLESKNKDFTPKYALVLILLSIFMLVLLFLGSTKKTLINCHRARKFNPYDLDNCNKVDVKDVKRKDSELIDIFEDDIIKRLGTIAMLPVLQHEMVFHLFIELLLKECFCRMFRDPFKQLLEKLRRRKALMNQTRTQFPAAEGNWKKRRVAKI